MLLRPLSKVNHNSKRKEVKVNAQATRQLVVDFDCLPEEVVLAIFSFVTSAEDLCCLSFVCKRFHLLSNDDQLWQPLCSPKWDVPPGGWKEAYMTWLRKAIPVYLGKEKVRHVARPSPSSSSEEYDLFLKIVPLGTASVGKSSLILRFVHDIFYDLTSSITFDFKIKSVNVEGKRVKVRIDDTAGDERFRTVDTSHLHRYTAGYLLVFDVNDLESFKDIPYWLSEIEHYGEDRPVLLVGNKTDIGDRKVDFNVAQQFATEHGMDYIETSAKTGENVSEAFIQLVTDIIVPPLGRGVPGPRPRYIPPRSTLEKMGIRPQPDSQTDPSRSNSEKMGVQSQTDSQTDTSTGKAKDKKCVTQ
jgi:small GTP-binding protein